MTIEAVELRRVAMPLATPLRTAHGTFDRVEKLLVGVQTPDVVGWGELGTDQAGDRGREVLDAADALLRRDLVPDVLTGAPIGRPSPFPVALAAHAAVEVAVLDAELRAAGRSLAEHLGAERDRVDSGVVVGIAGSTPALLDEVSHRIGEGYRRVKLKIEPGWDHEPVAAASEQHPDLALQVDANGSYTRADAEHLAGLDEFDLLMIEQPLPADDITGHVELAEQLRTPICLDETLTSFEVTKFALARGACSVVNLKPSRVGGLGVARRIHDLCVERGVALWCGGLLETGIGRAVNVALAALPGFTLAGDLSASNRYWETELTEPFVLDDDGRLAVPTGPGIGVEPLPDVLEAVTTSREILSGTD